MRILFWSATFWPMIGGVEVLAARLLPALQERGHEFVVITPKSYSNLPDHTRYHGIPVHRLQFRNSFAQSTMDYVLDTRRQVVKLKQDFAPDLVHINAVSRGDFFHLTTNNAYRVPSLVTLHGQWEKEIEPVVGHTLRSADWIAGCSGAILDKGQRLAPEIVPRSSVIYNAVAETSTLPEPLPVKAQRVLCIGRLSNEKGFDLALTAFASIVKRFPDLRLVMAGDGPERTRLANKAAEMGLKDAIDFLGWVAPENVPALINTATVVVMPSRAESLPMVALQAAQMARPVVGTRVGGLPEVVLHGRTGLLVEMEDDQALAEAIAHLLERPATATQMGQAARLQAQQAFSWERHVDSYDALYRKLVVDWRDRHQRHASV